MPIGKGAEKGAEKQAKEAAEKALQKKFPGWAKWGLAGLGALLAYNLLSGDDEPREPTGTGIPPGGTPGQPPYGPYQPPLDPELLRLLAAGGGMPLDRLYDAGGSGNYYPSYQRPGASY
jgi:hypothetical protein